MAGVGIPGNPFGTQVDTGEMNVSANMATFLGAANYAAMRAQLDLEAGTDFLSPAAIAAAYQALHANLTAFAGLTLIADRLPYGNGAGTLALATLTAAGRAVLDDADAAAQRATLGTNDIYEQSINTRKRNYRGRLPIIAGGATTASVAYFVYLGYTTEQVTPKHVKFAVTTGGTGAQTAEVGFFSTPLAPNGAGQTLTKLVADGTVDDLTTTGVKGNTSAMATAIAAGVHVWAGFRAAMATTPPAIAGFTRDYSRGEILSTAAAAALTDAGPWTGSLIAHSVAWQCPDLIGVLD